MNPILRNILAVIAGLIGGSLLNMSIIALSGSLIPPPVDADVTTMEGLKSTMHLFEPKHFLMPFLAHALGTLAGAFIAARLAANNKLKFGITIGCLFLIGGIINVFLLPSPVWFSITDLVLAYIPMGYLGGRLAIGKQH
jgi:hypothetical protein